MGKSPAAARQIAHRARAHVAAGRPRVDTSPKDARDAFAAFRHTIETGDLQGLADVPAPDVVALSDGDGVKQALPRPVVGVDKVARLLHVGLAPVRDRMTFEPAEVNGGPALIVRLDGEIDSVVSVHVESGLVSGLYTVRNPEKLSRIASEAAASR